MTPMPEMKITTANGNPRQVIRDARMDRMRRINDGRPATVKVYAANADMQRVLRHANGTRFRADLGEPVEWPNDTFTARRIAEGSVRIDGAASGDAAAPDPKLSPRAQAAARKPKPATTPAEPTAETKRHKSSPSS
jgi:hypothetical protein